MSKETKFIPPLPRPKGSTAPKGKPKSKGASVSKGQVMVIRGSGNYYTEKVKPFLQKHVPKGSLSKIGMMVGAHIGGPAGGAAGGYGGTKLAKLLGYGDYSVTENSLGRPSGALPMGEDIPKFATSGRGTRIVHREYVTDITAATAGFINKTFSLNPLNSLLFPWVSTLATQYQQYKFNGLVLEYKTMSTDYSAATSLGTVIMTTNYNANQLPFDNKVEMENTEFAVSAKPSLSQVHCVECDPRERVTEYLYVQPVEQGMVGANDARLSSFGNFQIATNGVTATSSAAVIGELWVSYDITFLKPVLNTVAGLLVTTTFTNPTATNYYFNPTTTVTQSTTQAAMQLIVGDATACTFPLPGTYMCLLLQTGSSSPNVSVTGTLGATTQTVYTTASTIAYTALIRVTVTTAGGKLTFALTAGGQATFRFSAYRVDDKNSAF